MVLCHLRCSHNDRHFLESELASDKLYLRQRYDYLNGLKQALQLLFGEQFPTLCDYWFRHLLDEQKEGAS